MSSKTLVLDEKRKQRKDFVYEISEGPIENDLQEALRQTGHASLATQGSDERTVKMTCFLISVHTSRDRYANRYRTGHSNESGQDLERSGDEISWFHSGKMGSRVKARFYQCLF